MEEKTTPFQDWIHPDMTWLEGLAYNPHPSLSTWLLANLDSVLYELSGHKTHLYNILSSNPAAVPFLLQRPEYATRHGLLSNSNPWVMKWIQPTLDEMMEPSFDFRTKRESVMYALSRNENPLIVECLEEYVPLEHQYWYCLSMNPSAIDFLLQHPEHIHWETFPTNPHPQAIEYMAEHPEQMETNPYGYIHVMLRNSCPTAGSYLRSIRGDDMYQGWAYRYGSLEEMNLEHVADCSLNHMAENPNAISYFKERPDLIKDRIFSLASNPAIFR